MQGLQCKHWCFTINNPLPEGEFPEDPLELCTYFVAGKEVGEQGTPHLQGFCSFKKSLRMTAVSKLMPRARLTMKSKYSTFKQASDYCKKGDQSKAEWDLQGIEGPNFGLNASFFEFGILPKTGGESTKRNWAVALDLAKQGNLVDIDANVLVPYYSSLKRIKMDNQKAPEPLAGVCGIWFWGDPGTGKSYAARTRYPGYFEKNLNKWWDNYREEDTVILDDIGHKEAEWIGTFLKRWSDRYSFPAEQKGTTTILRPKRIVVTSNYEIHQLFGTDHMMRKAVERRFVVEHFTKVWDELPNIHAAEVGFGRPILYHQDATVGVLPWTIPDESYVEVAAEEDSQIESTPPYVCTGQ